MTALLSEHPFTDYVRALATGDPPLDEPYFKAILKLLAERLRRALKKRGIYRTSPRLLGYKGQSWKDPNALEDLVADCHEFALLDRFSGLVALLEKGGSGNIEGAVQCNIQWFVSERQKQSDPDGYALFQNLQAALLRGVQEGLLMLVADGCAQDSAGLRAREIRAGWLSFPGEAAAEKSSPAALRQAMSTHQSDWDCALRQLWKVSTAAQQLVIEGLRRLRDAGLGRFRIKDLRDALYDDVRDLSQRPRDLSGTVGGEKIMENDGTWRTNSPTRTLALSEEFVSQVREAIDTLRKRDDIKQRFHRIFDYYLEHAADIGPDALRGTFSDAIPQAEIARVLEIPKQTLSDDLKLLKPLIAAALGDGGMRFDR